MREANFEIVQDDPQGPLVIRDVGPWERHPTVTNDAERVVARLVREGKLTPGRRLLYFDSDGYKDEIVVREGEFQGFRLGTRDFL